MTTEAVMSCQAPNPQIALTCSAGTGKARPVSWPQGSSSRPEAGGGKPPEKPELNAELAAAAALRPAEADSPGSAPMSPLRLSAVLLPAPTGPLLPLSGVLGPPSCVSSELTKGVSARLGSSRLLKQGE